MQDDDTASAFIAFMEDEKILVLVKSLLLIMALLLGWLLDKAIRKNLAFQRNQSI